MAGNPLRIVGIVVRVCALVAVFATLTGCGFKIAGPGETIAVTPLATEDVAGPCKFDMNLPDEPDARTDQLPDPNKPVPTQVAALVIYDRGDNAKLFQDADVQDMAAKLHMVTVFAHQCNASSFDDLQADGSKGPARALFAALTQYAKDSHHPEIANLKVILSGFSAAGVLTTTVVNAYPDRVLGFVPFASGSIYVDLDTVKVSAAAARVPALVLANAYDPDSGVQRSLRYFQRGWSQGAPWGFGVQNHTGHCCAASAKNLFIPWVTALVQPLETGATATPSTQSSVALPANPRDASGAVLPTVRFLCYTDGFYDAYFEYNCWIPSASILPSADGGPQAGWLPDAASANAWLKWVMSPGTN
jgi:dienelactone hydrolase